MHNDNITEINQRNSAHSILSPSKANIWLRCTPSAMMMALMPEVDTTYTSEGTDAHKLAEMKVRKALVEGDEDIDLDEVRNSLESYDTAMDLHTDGYLNFAKQIVREADEDGYIPDVHTEMKLNLEAFYPNGKGTSDLVIVAGDVLHVIDFKYGAFTPVSAVENPQLMIYSLGVIEQLKDEIGIPAEVMLTIYQPRMGNVSTWGISTEALEKWRDEVLLPQAKLASEGEGTLVEGKHCEFCTAKLVCRKKTEDILKRIDAIKKIIYGNKRDNMDLKKIKANMLSAEEIGDILSNSTGIGYWLEQLNRHALAEALDGEEYPGMKLVEEKGTLKLTEDAAPKLEKAGIDPWKAREIKSKSAIEKEIGKKLFNEYVKPLLVETESKPRLVPDSDARDAKSYTDFS